MGILFGHFPKYCCGHNTCEKRVSVISTFPQPAQVVCWSLDFLPPYSLLSAPKHFSSHNLHFWKVSHAPCIGKLTGKCPLCSTRSPSLLTTASTFSPEHDAIFVSSVSNDVVILVPATLLLGAEIPLFQNENSFQINAYLHYSNYSYSGLIPNKRALNKLKTYLKMVHLCTRGGPCKVWFKIKKATVYVDKGDSSEMKVANELFSKFLWMFPTKHCFEKYKKIDRTPCSQKRHDEPILPHLCLYSC